MHFQEPVAFLIQLLIEEKQLHQRLESVQNHIDCICKAVRRDESPSGIFIGEILPNLPSAVLKDETIMGGLKSMFGVTDAQLLHWSEPSDFMET